MKWHEKWQANVVTFPMTKAQIDVWEEEMREKTGGVTKPELMAAVERVAERKRMGKLDDHPNCGDIVAAIWFARKQKTPAHKSRLEILTKLKADMKAAMPDKNEAMNILCRCDDLELIQRAEAYARHELGFTRPTMQEMGANGVQGQIGGLIKNVTNEVKTRDRS